AGRMPAGIMIESGQADLMLVSYLGIDFLNQGERAYRLLGCELTYHRDLPAPGETLCYDIHVDGHANQGPIRLFFFHYDCRINGQPAISVRDGQAGFFTVEELAESAGVLWTPEEQEIRADARMDAPEALTEARSFTAEQVRAFSEGRPWECFGETHFWTKTHTRTPTIQSGNMLFLQDITSFEPQGGPWKRGYLKIEVDISPDDWFFTGHFKNDPCMPGTLMFEGCLQAMAFYLAALGFTTDRDGWRFQPVAGVAYPLRCRGQVIPTSRKLTYEIFVEEVIGGPTPTLFADLLCTVDGLKAFHARGMGLELVADWPMTSDPKLLAEIAAIDAASGPVATDAEGFPFDYAALMACAWGKPSQAFGSMYTPFDGHRRVARLPGPPYHFMSRVTRIDGGLNTFKPGVTIELEYDIPPDAWYFENNGHPTMPFCVLLEAALQPCGWLASGVGSALSVDRDLSFRNLDGTGTMHVEVVPTSGTFRTEVTITNISSSAGMIIESFDVRCSVGDTLVYDLQTVFGFFPEEALKNQIGLSTTDAQRGWLTCDSDLFVDLTTRPEKYCGGAARLAKPMMLMLDRITGYWPDAGEAGLGILRGEKDVDPAEWFFKAHFFQDPVQPGSLGLEAMLQLLQFYMLEVGMADGMAHPHFEPLALHRPMTWKYRGQVTPHNSLIASTIEVTEVGTDDHGRYAIAKGSLWVDGKRIYESPDFGMRLVSGEPAPEDDDEADPNPSITLDPKTDTWLSDHRPTFNRPALPMMSMVDLLAGAAEADAGMPLIGLKNVRVHRWVDFDGPRTLRTVVDGDSVSLLDGDEVVATAQATTGAYCIPPTPLPPLNVTPRALPYDTGELFHGPAFQLMTRWALSHDGASSLLDAAASGLPPGTLSPGLLDAATHAIPHDALHRWDDDLSEEKVAYPALITELTIHGPTPRTGEVRCEVRYKGTLGSVDYPMFTVQLIAGGQVWASMTLVEACFPKGALGSAPPSARRDFLQHHRYVPGLRLSDDLGDHSVLHIADVAATDWLPGTVQGIYNTTDPEQIAIKEHDAARTGIHPSLLPDALPMSILPIAVTHRDNAIIVRNDGPEELDLTDIRDYWTDYFDRDPWPVEDLYYGLIQRFVRRVVLADPAAMSAVRGRSVVYLGNHQTGIESLLFSIMASALGGVPTVTLAKIEHQHTWLGKLIKLCFDYPGISDPRVIAFFDRTDKASLPKIIGELAAEMISPGRSVMVHVEGTRALSCRKPVEKMSGAFIDMALKVNAPIVPVRFIGGLPTAPLDTRIEFPVGMGRQDYWFGRPILPEELAGIPYGERKKVVIAAINGLGPDNAVEEPIGGDPAFAHHVETWQQTAGVTHEHATLLRILQSCESPCAQTAALLDAVETPPMQVAAGLEGAWLAELGRRLLGQRG
ncbi:MAG: 3-hydroxymyristoyl/3-hydroxydecanoyl-(acyl carrier protein) dehydratase, partial [Myxococcota bacterium]